MPCSTAEFFARKVFVGAPWVENPPHGGYVGSRRERVVWCVFQAGPAEQSRAEGGRQDRRHSIPYPHGEREERLPAKREGGLIRQAHGMNFRKRKKEKWGEGGACFRVSAGKARIVSVRVSLSK